MTAAAIATMATVDAARIIVPVFSVPLLLKRRWRSCGCENSVRLQIRCFRISDQALVSHARPIT